ncbi:hypothetical protein FHW58_004176 [Duganella sp. 1224]|uniref:EF-hand domain-containing protein n=1 Tax=Duganella sp. 1224 TaxID=2587052 RepID=UPI001855FEB0|nr:EF-hand domain-containing protein [Duganella sp. 1224]NYE62954.1 hypothetical protein [Duganella sp. 1224]
MKILQLVMLTAVGMTALSHAGAQAPQPDAPAAMRGAEPYLPPALRKPLRDATGTALLRYQPMQKLKKRFEAADVDGSGTLSREEARQAGLTVVDKNFDHIDTAQRGAVSFDDLKTFLIQRREEAHSR